MKQFLSLLLGVILLFGFQTNALCGDKSKIGVFDLQKIQQNSSAFRNLSESYMKKLEPKKNELEQLQNELVELRGEIRKQNMMLSLDAKMDKTKEMGKKERKLEYLMSEFRQETKIAEMEIKRSLFNDLMKIAEEISKKDGYILILEKSSSGFLYSSDSIDITDKVIKAYDKMN